LYGPFAASGGEWNPKRFKALLFSLQDVFASFPRGIFVSCGLSVFYDKHPFVLKGLIHA